MRNIRGKFFILLALIIITSGIFYMLFKSRQSEGSRRTIPAIPKENLRSLISSALSDNQKALEQVKDLAEHGDVKAQRWLGSHFYKNINESVKWYSKAGDQKDEEALYRLYEKALENNNKEAFQCLLRNTDDLETKRRVGSLYANRNKAFYNPADAQKHFDEIKEAADKGDAEAQYQLGIMYTNAQGVEKSLEKAVEYYKKSAAQNNAKAQFTLGNMYYRGNSTVKQNKQEAFNLYLKAAENRNPDAIRKVIQAYQNGDMVEKNVREATKWRLIEVDYDKNDASISLFYYHAKDGDSEALYALRELAEKDYEEAQYYLGLLYHDGKGVKKDYKEAVKWYLKAYRLGNLTSAVSAIEKLFEAGVPETIEVIEDYAHNGNAYFQAELGRAYMRGIGVKKDYSEALKWLQKSSDQNHDTGHYLLAVMYYNGLGVKQDYAKAAHLMGRAGFGDGPFSIGGLGAAMTAYRRDANIVYGRGLILRDGLYNVKANKDAALKLFIEAANMGSNEANFTLGDMYEHGKDVAMDYNKAAEYYAKAAQNDDKRSLERLKSLASDGNTIAKQQYNSIVTYVSASIERNDYYELLNICERGALSEFKDKYTKLKLSPEAVYANAKEFIYNSLLTLAASVTSNAEIIKFLISKGADVNRKIEGFRDSGGDIIPVTDMTALMKACMSCYEEDIDRYDVVKALIEAGADVNAKDSEGMTALDWALDTAEFLGSSNLEKKIIELLLESGADAKNSLQYVFTGKDCTPEILKMLIEAGAEVDNEFLVIAAANTIHPEVIELLVNGGANAKVKSEIKDFKGKRAIDLAKDNPNLKNTRAIKILDEASYESAEEREREETEKKAALQKMLQKAEAGNVEIQNELGYMYWNGTGGVDEDGAKSVYWFKKAAANKSVIAMESLGKIYRNGLSGVKKDDEEADFWFRERQKALNEARQKSIQAAFQANASITGNKVNIRTKPTTSSNVVKQLNAGHPIKAAKQTKAKDGIWYYIQTASGTQGWVFGKYVKFNR